MEFLRGAIQPYAWGSPTAIPDLLGTPATGEPQAELWLGAHPVAPATVERDGRWQRLDAVIAADPVGELGVEVASRFDGQLPFLLKVLAAVSPLSLQAHPDEVHARAGHQREEAAGLAMGAPNRIYKDPHHKPELICALTPFDALCGFRPVPATLDLLDAVATRGLRPFAAELAAAPGPNGLRTVLGQLLTVAPGDRGLLADEVAASCAAHDGPWHPETTAIARIAGWYPGDIGVVIALLLNFVRLQPGQAIYLGAGNVHAYLDGVGVEVMANSDNVLRGGLTPKHIDVPELMDVVDFTPLADPIVPPLESLVGCTYPTPAPEFQLTRLDLEGHDLAGQCAWPAIALCTAGDVSSLRRGQSAFLRAGSEWHFQGTGTVFLATVGSLA